MANLRKRFYLALHSNGAREILSLRYMPSAALLAESSTTINRVIGPFHTLALAAEALAMPNIAGLIRTLRKAPRRIERAA